MTLLCMCSKTVKITQMKTSMLLLVVDNNNAVMNTIMCLVVQMQIMYKLVIMTK